MTPCVMVDSGSDSKELEAAAMKRDTCSRTVCGGRGGAGGGTGRAGGRGIGRRRGKGRDDTKCATNRTGHALQRMHGRSGISHALSTAAAAAAGPHLVLISQPDHLQQVLRAGIRQLARVPATPTYTDKHTHQCTVISSTYPRLLRTGFEQKRSCSNV